jgi:hypothetical protein
MSYSGAGFYRKLPANFSGVNGFIGFLKKPVVYHTSFWALYFIFNVFRWGSYNQDYLNAFYNNLIEFPMHIGLAYLNIYYLIPRYLPRRYYQYILLVSIGILLAVGGRIFLEDIFAISPNNTLTNSQYVLELVIGEVYVQGFLTAFKFLLDWGRNQKRMRELQKSNFESELNFLRSQVQPHFFFNTLNNLYSLTLDKSDMAPETVLKLSELMSYVIYDGKQKKVHVAREIGYIQNYLDLERLRFGTKISTTFDVHGQVDNQKIAPLLMLPFIENSFKHGVGDGIDEIKIDVRLEVNPADVVFTVRNRKFKKLSSPAPGPYHHIGHNGVGIKNIQRRLNLIYGNRYKLDIKDESDKYTVTLKIPTYEN